MNKLIALVLTLACCIPVKANHFTGAHLRYEYTGTPLAYVLHLTLYKTCESTAIGFPSFIKVHAESKQQNELININLGLKSLDTLQPYCPSITSSCNNINSQYPGYTIARYSDTIHFTVAAGDWNIVFSNGSRALNILNLSGASGQSFYVDAPLNLVGLNNNSAVFPDLPPHVLFVNDSISIPLSATDADGDTISYSFITPESSTGVSIPYYTGYSVTAPFGTGGLCYIKNNNTMVLKSAAVGKYTIALKATEYRNGSYIGYTTRDFVVICISGSGKKLSIPEPDNRENMITSTCPGRSNYLALNFIDPAPGDSVYLEIIPPVIPGFTFNTTAKNGIGAATGNISWTTPVTMNPNTLKFFDFEVKVRDNACDLIGKGTYVYRVNTKLCSADSVWPGDANKDKKADMYDALAVAMTYGDTGAARPNASNNWVAQYCTFWNGAFLNNIDTKHTDCNGDGQVDTADLNAINANYGKTHAKGGGAQQKTTAGPDLYFDHTGITPNPDSTVTIKMLLGTSSAPIANFYGLATNVHVNGLTLATPPKITYTSNWIGNNTNTLNFIKETSPTSVDWAYARTNQQNVSGQGVIANLEFKIPATTQGGSLVTLSYSNTKIIDKDGKEHSDFNTLIDTFYIRFPDYITTINSGLSKLQLYPNPSGSQATLSLFAPQPYNLNIVITDVTGKVLSNKETQIETGTNSITLPAVELTQGIYFVRVSSKEAGFDNTLKWIRK